MAKLIEKGPRTRFIKRIDWFQTVTDINVGFILFCIVGMLVCNLVPAIANSNASTYVNIAATSLLAAMLVLYIPFALMLIFSCKNVSFKVFNVKELQKRLIICSSIIGVLAIVAIALTAVLTTVTGTALGLGIADAVVCLCWFVVICVVCWFNGRCRKRVIDYQAGEHVVEYE